MSNNGEEIAQEILTSAGLNTTKIPENDGKTADFFATVKDEEYLIEVKTKDDNNPLYQNLSETGPVSQTRPIGPRNRMAAIISGGMEQIEESDQFNKNTFNIIWLHSTGLDSSYQAEQILHTFYGMKEVLDMDQKSDEGIKSYPCYGFTFAEAYNQTNLDGIFLSSRGQSNISVGLRVNPYAKKIDKFRKSKLYEHFDKLGALTDPKISEEKGRAFFVEDKLDLRKPAEVLDYLRKRYNKPGLDTFDWQQASVAMSVPNNI